MQNRKENNGQVSGRDMNNYKPYRTQAQKAAARATATKGKDGAWHSNAPVSYHKVRPAMK